MMPRSNRFENALRLFAAAVVLAAALPATAQNTDPLVYTIGKVIPGAGNDFAYILWQPGDPTATFGKRFAIYRKNGAADSPDPYLKLGEQELQTGPTAIQALLKLGGRFDFNAGEVADRINTLYADSYSVPGTPASGPEPGIEEARKLARLLGTAAADPAILERIFFLGRTHPGVMMAMGHGFAIKVPNPSLFTYEIRQLDGGGNDVRVVGRVTLDAANPTQLTRPGRPVQVNYAAKTTMHEVGVSPLDHLSVRLRWGVPDALRRLFPHSFGFNLYRVKESVAEGLTWDVLPPTPADMESLVAASAGMEDPDAKRVNTVPVMLTALMTLAEAQNLVADPDTAFAADDNDPPDNPFEDGETFYYFVAPRDIAGHPGLLSRGTEVMICDRLPPLVTRCESVRNIYSAPDTSNAAGLADLKALKGTQHFRIRIRQVPETPSEDAASEYHLYRWKHHTEHLEKGHDPNVNRIAIIPHVPGEQYVDYDDVGAGAPIITSADDALAGKTFWYTVRSVDSTACVNKNYSGHSGPCFGVLRDRTGPGRPTGSIRRCILTPTLECTSGGPQTRTSLGLPTDFVGFVLRATRLTKAIQGFDVRLRSNIPAVPTDVFRTSRSFSIADTKDVAVPIPIPDPADYTLFVRCRAKNGVVNSGNWVQCPLNPPPGAPDSVNVELAVLNAFANYVLVPASPVPDPHDVLRPDGGISGVQVDVTVPAGSTELRIYRRVGTEGAFEMIHRVDGTDLPSPLPDVVSYEDEAQPTESGVEVCYFAQVFDENGNSGPRVKLGCIETRSTNLPTPLLEEANLLSAVGNLGQVRLTWFCDPVGVERFEVWAASTTMEDPGLESDDLSPQKLGTISGTVVSDETDGVSFCGYQTGALEGDFGTTTAQYSIDVKLPVPQVVSFAVRAVGKGTYDEPPIEDKSRPTGDFSNVVTATWKIAPGGAQAVVPWPSLPVPPTGEIGLPVDSYLLGEGPFYAFPLPATEDAAAAIFVGAYQGTVSGIGEQPLPFPIAEDPLDFFFKFRKQNIDPIGDDGAVESIIPFVVYRHQLPTATNPNVVPNLVQVSPFIDRIAYKTLNAAEREPRDPFFRVRDNISINPDWLVPVAGNFSRDPSTVTVGQPALGPPPYLTGRNAYLYWLDRLPVVKGARYQYLLVHFDERGEIDRVIPTNFVDQP